MSKRYWTVIGATLFLALFVININAHALDREALKAEIKEEIKEELKSEGGSLAGLKDRIQLSGLIEFGGAWKDVDNRDGTDDEQSDLALTTVELTAGAEINEWVNVEATLLYEDPTFDNAETSVDLDAATLTIGNTEQYPLYFSAGAMYVPFGALLTHFPDDPLIDVPLTVVLGETREKAALVGVEHKGFSVSAYVFNGDMDETGKENQIESYGFDANYALDDEKGTEILVGGSYISNIADSETLTDAVGASIAEYVGGFDCYLHVGYAPFFFDAEYMTATDSFEASELATGAAATGAEPAVWNFEVGYNLDWGKNLEIAVKYAGSDETDTLGFPEERYGIAFNQDIFDGVVASLAYIHDEYDDNDTDSRDERSVVFGQIAIEF